jgi:predicted dehydrogenase
MPLPKKQLNIAMVGNGSIARAHANAFHQVAHFFDVKCELRKKLLCGRSPEKLSAFAAQWGFEETATDWASAVNRADIDIVDIATPNALHAPTAIAAAQAGKIVFCEKPLATSVEEAQKMSDAVGVNPSLVWFNYRRVPAISFARQLIDEGRLGQVFHYRSHYFNQSGADPAKGQTWRYKREQAGSGVLGDLLSHSLDTATYLNGPISSLCAATHTFIPGRDVDDAVTVMARFANQSVGSFEASRFGVGRRNGNGFEIYGSKSSLAFDFEDMNRLQFFDATLPPPLQAWSNLLMTGPGHPYVGNFWKPGHLIGYEHTFIATLADFLHALSNEQEFHPNFADALQTQRLMEAVQSSANAQEWILTNNS